MIRNHYFHRTVMNVSISGTCPSMSRMKLFSMLAASALLVVDCFFMCGCSSTAELSSAWNNNQVVIDGKADEWTSHTYFLNDAHVSIGIRNDSDFAYVCIMSAEGQFRRELVGLGMTVWFQPEGGAKLGVHYPVGMQGRVPAISEDRENMEDAGEQERTMEPALQDVEIIGPDKNDHRLFTTLNLTGIGVKVANNLGSMVYELKVPLRKAKGQDYALGVEPGATIHFSIETGKHGSSEGEKSMKMGDGGGGGRRGGRGGRRSPGEQEPSGESQEGGEKAPRASGANRAEPLNLSAKVTLARPTPQEHF
jgi:hypothetical protein